MVAKHSSVVGAGYFPRGFFRRFLIAGPELVGIASAMLKTQTSGASGFWNRCMSLFPMSSSLSGLMVGAACFATFSTADAKTVYVNDDIVTAGDGSTWGKAFKYLRDALDATVAGDQIFLTAGVYYPDDGKTGDFGNRELAFDLDGQLIFGGFVGTETSLAQRDPELNVTVLSGAIWNQTGDDVYWSLHVTVASDSSTLDGVTVESGNASGSDSWNYPGVAFYDEGGGCYLRSGKTLTLNDCIFRDNRALSFGGAIRIESDNGKVVATDCLFQDNFIPVYDITTSVPEGGAIKGDVTATNCSFIDNSVISIPVVGTETSTARGGAISGKVTANSCVFSGNTITANGPTSVAEGGAIYGTVIASKTEFTGNTSDKTGGQNSYSTGGAITGGSLQAFNCVFDSNTSGEGYFVQNGNGRAFGGGGALFLEGGNNVIANSLFIENTSEIRGGAIQGASEGHADSLTITNSTFLDNGVPTVGNGLGSSLSCAGIVRIMNNIFWHTANTAGAYKLDNQIHVIVAGVLRNTDIFYPTPATVAQNVVKGTRNPITQSPITQGAGADVFIGNATETMLAGDPLFTDLADPDGADNIPTTNRKRRTAPFTAPAWNR